LQVSDTVKLFDGGTPLSIEHDTLQGMIVVVHLQKGARTIQRTQVVAGVQRPVVKSNGDFAAWTFRSSEIVLQLQYPMTMVTFSWDVKHTICDMSALMGGCTLNKHCPAIESD